MCALGWACWKTYLGRPETDQVRSMAIGVLGSGLSNADHDEDALSVREAELSLKRRLGASAESILVVQCNLSNTYYNLGRLELAIQMKRDVYFGYLRLFGEESKRTILTADNYAIALARLKLFEEAKSLLRKTMPVARRVLGESHHSTLSMRWVYAKALYEDASTLDDLCEAVTTLESVANSHKRVLGESHPETPKIQGVLADARNRLARAVAASESKPPP